MSHVVQIFIAYARRDAALLDEFRMHLKPLERGRKIQVWYHCLNEPGAVWDHETKRRLYVSDIILFLISADAIASDFFYEKEVAEVLERHLMGEVRVALMILRPCAWEATSLAKLQAIPQNGKPVVFWSDREKAYADAARALLAIADSLEQREREKAAESRRLRETADYGTSQGTEASSVHAAAQRGNKTPARRSGATRTRQNARSCRPNTRITLPKPADASAAAIGRAWSIMHKRPLLLRPATTPLRSSSARLRSFADASPPPLRRLTSDGRLWPPAPCWRFCW